MHQGDKKTSSQCRGSYRLSVFLTLLLAAMLPCSGLTVKAPLAAQKKSAFAVPATYTKAQHFSHCQGKEMEHGFESPNISSGAYPGSP